MKGFSVKQSDLEQIRQGITAGCEAMAENLSSCRQQLEALVADASFRGTFAETFKGYLTQVHLQIADAGLLILQELVQKVRDYTDGYKGIEQKKGFILNEGEMSRFSDTVSGIRNQLSGCHDTVLDTLQQIGDIIQPQTPGIGLVMDETRRIVEGIRDFRWDISDYETRTRASLSQLETYIASFKSVVSLAFASGGTAAAGFQSSLFLMLPAFEQLLDLLAQKTLPDTELSEEAIERLKGFGYGEAQIQRLYEGCAGEDDKDFFTFLALGDYASAFQTDPFYLSEHMNLLLADLAFRIYEKGDYQELEDLNNALLARSEQYVTLDYHWSVANQQEYRHKYLARLYAGTMLLLDMNSFRILAGDLTPETRERNWAYLSLANLWNAEYQVMESIGNVSDRDYPYYVDFTAYDPLLHRMDFNFMYFCPAFLGKRKSCLIPVQTDVLETSEDLVTASYLTEREELVEEADNLWKTVLAGGLEDALSGILSAVLPGTSKIYEMIHTMIRKPGNLGGELLDELGNEVLEGTGEMTENPERGFPGDGLPGDLSGGMPKGPGGNSGFSNSRAIASSVGESLMDMLQSYHSKKAELMAAIARQDEGFRNAFWGSGGLARFNQESCIISGLYNPDYLETIYHWNQEGIQALLPESDRDALAAMCGEKGMPVNEEVYGLVTRMINGFDGGSILDYPIDQIAQAKTILEDLVRSADPAYRTWNVEDAFS